MDTRCLVGQNYTKALYAFYIRYIIRYRCEMVGEVYHIGGDGEQPNIHIILDDSL
jgi:hypothetical protein